ncbi:MAG: epoxyqueuosine reductase [Clostridia bacterium]|nr:epoxyqueuosine reductase [Clostridia bacterium]
MGAVDRFLRGQGIERYAYLPFSACRVIQPRKLQNLGEVNTVLVLTVPYNSDYSGDSDARNVSLYAAAKDYHLFFKELFVGLKEAFLTDHPGASCHTFADSSPIDEVDAAAKAGLGLLGDNRMLIDETYGPFVFIGELFTDAKIPCEAKDVRECEHCGRCICRREPCLSALTQKKGELTEEEKVLLQNHTLVWGCDDCLLACPHAENVLPSPIPFFRQDLILYLTRETVEAMDEDQFTSRAFSWRKRETILRNLKLREESNTGTESPIIRILFSSI